MHRQVQPAMRVGGGAPRPRLDDDLEEPGTHRRALARGWAVARLVALVIACGLGAAVAIAVSVAAIVTLLDSSL
jgi:hypothetical protein